jgi:Na+-driven multidrug efflux pump
LLRKTAASASAGAVGAVVAALLAAVTEPVLNRVVGRRMTIKQALKEVGPGFILRYFRTALATNLVKFPFFEAVNTLSASLVFLPGVLRGVIAAVVYTTFMLPVANYRYAVSLQVRVKLRMLYQAYLPTLLRDIIYGITRAKMMSLLLSMGPANISVETRSWYTFVAVGVACTASSPFNELRAFILQPRKQRLKAREFFKAREFMRSTLCSSLTVALALACGCMLVGTVVTEGSKPHPIVSMLVALCCFREFRLLSLVGLLFGALKLETARQYYDNMDLPAQLKTLSQRYKESYKASTDPWAEDERLDAERAAKSSATSGTLKEERLEASPEIPTGRALAHFVAPAFCNVVANSSMSAVDKLSIGYHSTLQLAALGPAATAFDGGSYLLTFLNTATMSLLGAAVDDQERAKRVRSHAIILATGSAICLGTFLSVFAVPLCRLLGATPAMLPFSVIYLQLRALGAPVERGTSVSTSFCLASKDGTTPLMVTLIGLGVNVVLDMTLCPMYGSSGVAVASVMASTLGYAYLIKSLIRRGLWPWPLSWPRGYRDVAPFLGFAGPVLLAVFLKILTFGQMTRAACGLGTSAAAAHQIFVTLFYLTAVALGNPFSWAAQAFLPPLLAAEAKGQVPNDGRPLPSMRALQRIVITSGFTALSVSFLVVFLCRTLLAASSRDSGVGAFLSQCSPALIPFLTLYPVLLTLEGALYSVQRQGQVLKLSMVFFVFTCAYLSLMRYRGYLSLSNLWLGTGLTCGLAGMLAVWITSRAMQRHARCCRVERAS